MVPRLQKSLFCLFNMVVSYKDIVRIESRQCKDWHLHSGEYCGDFCQYTGKRKISGPTILIMRQSFSLFGAFRAIAESHTMESSSSVLLTV